MTVPGGTERIRPKDDKHPVLLPVGEKAQFRMDKDKIKLRVEDLDDKERDYIHFRIPPSSPCVIVLVSKDMSPL